MGCDLRVSTGDKGDSGTVSLASVSEGQGQPEQRQSMDFWRVCCDVSRQKIRGMGIITGNRHNNREWVDVKQRSVGNLQRDRRGGDGNPSMQLVRLVPNRMERMGIGLVARAGVMQLHAPPPRLG